MADDVKAHLGKVAATVEGFAEGLDHLFNALRAKIAALTQPAPSQPDFSAELTALDAADEHMSAIVDAFNGLANADTTAAQNLPSASEVKSDLTNGVVVSDGGVVVSDGDGVTPIPGSVVPPGPTTGAPGGAVTPTGSHDLGPGGGGPMLPDPATAFPTTVSGRPPAAAQPSAQTSSGDSGAGGAIPAETAASGAGAEGVLVTDITSQSDEDKGEGGVVVSDGSGT